MSARPLPEGSLVYVAGPYSHGDQASNVRDALEAADRLLDAGYQPYVPHLWHYREITHPRPYERWLELDFAFLDRCDALIRLPGYSPGADREAERARGRGLPVFASVGALRRGVPMPTPAHNGERA